MSYQVLARKWRPRRFAEVVGQEHILRALTNALEQDRLHHAYLFTGTRGVGKTTLARILAKCLNCEHGVSADPCGTCSACVGIDEGRFVDLVEVDAASRAKVEETRDLMDNVQYAPAAGRYKVYLIDEVHMFSGHSFNALLKTLEEPPPHVKFLLATTEPKRIPVTILSRCLQFNLKHLSAEQIEAQLARILEAEGVAHDHASLQLIARAATGSMRDALSLLDQAIAYGNGALKEPQVRAMLGTIDAGMVLALLECLANQDAAGLLERVAALAELNPDYDAIFAELLQLLQQIAVIHMVGADDAPDHPQRDALDALAGRISGEDAQLYYQIALLGRRDLPYAPDPRAGLEMCLIRMLAFRPQDMAQSGATRSAAPAPAPRGPAGMTRTQTREVSIMPAAPADDRLLSPADWHTAIEQISVHGLARQLASHCVLKSHTREQLHLVLPPAYQHMRNKTQEARLQEALRARFGPQLKVLITVEEPDHEAPVEIRAREDAERQQQAVQAIEEDPTVKAFQETFGATLDRNSIQPK